VDGALGDAVDAAVVALEGAAPTAEEARAALDAALHAADHGATEAFAAAAAVVLAALRRRGAFLGRDVLATPVAPAPLRAPVRR